MLIVYLVILLLFSFILPTTPSFQLVITDFAKTKSVITVYAYSFIYLFIFVQIRKF